MQLSHDPRLDELCSLLKTRTASRPCFPTDPFSWPTCTRTVWAEKGAGLLRGAFRRNGAVRRTLEKILLIPLFEQKNHPCILRNTGVVLLFIF
jgi:hypothetical protein